MKKSITKLLIGVGIGACLILSGCGSSNNDMNAGTYQIIGTDASSSATYVLLNVNNTIKRAYIPMGTNINDINAIIGNYAVVNNDKIVINIKKEGNK